MDVYDKPTRSYVMSRIRGRDTRPELRLRRMLWASGARGYRLRAKLPGSPDLVYRRARVAIFVDGCFWHGCPKCRIPIPASNRAYWIAKVERNKARDRRVRRRLRSRGWRLLRFWEHHVLRSPGGCVAAVLKVLGSQDLGTL